jgi:hypothetical protein
MNDVFDSDHDFIVPAATVVDVVDTAIAIDVVVDYEYFSLLSKLLFFVLLILTRICFFLQQRRVNNTNINLLK